MLEVDVFRSYIETNYNYIYLFRLNSYIIWVWKGRLWGVLYNCICGVHPWHFVECQLRDASALASYYDRIIDY